MRVSCPQFCFDGRTRRLICTGCRVGKAILFCGSGKEFLCARADEGDSPFQSGGRAEGGECLELAKGRRGADFIRSCPVQGRLDFHRFKSVPVDYYFDRLSIRTHHESDNVIICSQFLCEGSDVANFRSVPNLFVASLALFSDCRRHRSNLFLKGGERFFIVDLYLLQSGFLRFDLLTG